MTAAVVKLAAPRSVALARHWLCPCCGNDAPEKFLSTMEWQPSGSDEFAKARWLGWLCLKCSTLCTDEGGAQ